MRAFHLSRQIKVRTTVQNSLLNGRWIAFAFRSPQIAYPLNRRWISVSQKPQEVFVGLLGYEASLELGREILGHLGEQTSYPFFR
jgi:hypothetical protein